MGRVQQDAKRKQMYEQRWRKMHGDFLAGIQHEIGDSRKAVAEQRPRATLGKAMATASQAFINEAETIDVATALAHEKELKKRRAVAEQQQYFVRGRLTHEVIDTLLDEKATDVEAKWSRHTTLQIPERDAIGREQSKRLTDLQRPGLQAVLRAEASLRDS